VAAAEILEAWEDKQELLPTIDPTIDLDRSPTWGLNLGVGVGMTRSTDHLIVKMILGYRFDF
jgi:hypothetical protein